MFEWWLEQKYPQLERKYGAAEKFEDFEEFTGGPSTSKLAKKMPRRVLEERLREQRPPHVMAIISAELARRTITRHQFATLALSVFSTFVALAPLVRTL